MDPYKERYSSLQAHLDIPKPLFSNCARPDSNIGLRSRFSDYIIIHYWMSFLINCRDLHVNSKRLPHSDFIQKLTDLLTET